MFYRGLVSGTLLLALAACSGPDAPATETPRAVKLERFGAGSDSPLQVPALVRQEQRAELAFEGAGRLSAVLVDVGDRVTRGQVLARLDDEPLRLREQQADAHVRAALAQSGERQLQLRQQQAMFDDGASSHATLTAARAAADAASAQLQAARADLAMARVVRVWANCARRSMAAWWHACNSRRQMWQRGRRCCRWKGRAMCNWSPRCRQLPAPIWCPGKPCARVWLM